MIVPIIISCLLFLAGCSPYQDYDRTFLLMGTVVKVKVRHAAFPRQALDNVIARMKIVEGTFNRYDKSSELYRINTADKSEGIIISQDMSKVLNTAFILNKLTHGALDATIAPLEKLWGFYGKGTHDKPDEASIKKMLEIVGMQNLIFDEDKKKLFFKYKEVTLDFNATAKGYAVDEAIKVLRSSGVQEALVDAGGDIFCLGKNRGNDWVIGIRDPRDTKQVIGTLALADKGVATSGGYENFTIIDGKKYPHIMDPRSGYPVMNDVLSTTVIADTCQIADGLATAFFVLGADESINIVEDEEGVDCIIICEEEGGLEFFISSGITDRLKLRTQNTK